MRKIACFVFSILLVLSVSFVANAQADTVSAQNYEKGTITAYKTDVKGNRIQCVEGSDLVLSGIRVTGPNQDIIITTNVVFEEEHEIESDRGIPEKQKTKRFNHRIYDSANIYLVTACVTVTGIYSEVDHTAYLTNISCYYTGPYSSSFYYATSISGATGTCYIIYANVIWGYITYQIYPNGTIQQINVVAY